MKKITLGILAHVDAGKTTLTEAMLYNSGAVDKLGRVDNGSCLLDGHQIERERGITVFSKLARFERSGVAFTLVDTPGHLDFYAEAERSLSIQDYAVLVVNATEGAVSHTVTLLRQLRSRRIPTFIFVNKMDMRSVRRVDIVSELRVALGSNICDFNLRREDEARFLEECAGCDERLIGEYLDTGTLSDESITDAILSCRLIPCHFGSALKNTGVNELLDTVCLYTKERSFSKTLFGARVFKIMTAPDGTRLSYMKLTGGELHLKDTLKIPTEDGGFAEERVEQIRLYNADKFKQAKSAAAGEVIAVPSLKHTKAGMGLGTCEADFLLSEPVLDYKMELEEGCDIHRAYLDLLPLGEEEPTLNLRYDSESREIRVRLMGQIQTEVLTRLIKERFGLSVKFGEAGVVYRETVTDTVYGAGHFEPLTHYAEVRLRLEPLPTGSGLVFTTEVPQDILKTNWQRLILSHLEERAHRGKLIGAPITDMKITVVGGRAHPKHTEGGDFRQATLRALNQALMKARARGDMLLLEPYFNFEATLPEGTLGRFLNDMEVRHGECEAPEFSHDGAVTVRGRAPVYNMRSYQSELRAYTKGEGRLSLTAGDYLPCHNAETVIAERAYDPESDSRANPNSVFCKGGAGYTVPWYESDAKMHTPPVGEALPTAEQTDVSQHTGVGQSTVKTPKDYRSTVRQDEELMRIFEATYGKITPRRISEKTTYEATPKERRRPKPLPKGDDYLIIDGYNLIFANEELAAVAKAELAHARELLIRLMCNYRGYQRSRVIIVFDAYRKRDNAGSTEEFGGVTVIYTKERQTADAYIERATYEIKAPDTVRVVTDDRDEQLIILGNGGLRVTTREFITELETVAREINEILNSKK